MYFFLALLFVFLLYYITIQILKASHRAAERKAQIAAEKKAAQEREAAQKRELEARQQKLEKQKQLVQQYTNSSLTKQMLNIICKGNPQKYLPSEILIYNNRIQGVHGAEICSFDFAANRVQPLAHAHAFSRNYDDIHCLIKPQIAMAEAINTLLGNNYNIEDYADEQLDFRTDSFGDEYHTYSYTSNHVKMIIKSTRSF